MTYSHRHLMAAGLVMAATLAHMDHAPESAMRNKGDWLAPRNGCRRLKCRSTRPKMRKNRKGRSC
jgi:hypothetical protein